MRRRGIDIDVIAGSVTDAQMGQDYIEKEFGVPAANARRDGARLFELIKPKVSSFEFRVSSSKREEPNRIVTKKQDSAEGVLA
jgi:hypothetical protein